MLCRTARVGLALRHGPHGQGIGYVPQELLQELTREAEAPEEQAANVQLEGNQLQLVPNSDGFTAMWASGEAASQITIAQMSMGPEPEVLP